jgi:hypothetical protein
MGLTRHELPGRVEPAGDRPEVRGGRDALVAPEGVEVGGRQGGLFLREQGVQDLRGVEMPAMQAYARVVNLRMDERPGEGQGADGIVGGPDLGALEGRDLERRRLGAAEEATTRAEVRERCYRGRKGAAKR